MKSIVIIPPAKLDLQTFVATYMSCQSCERLLSCASYSNQQGIASFLTYHPGDPVRSKTEKDSSLQTWLLLRAPAPEKKAGGKKSRRLHYEKEQATSIPHWVNFSP
jgi:hypothetical protein